MNVRCSLPTFILDGNGDRKQVDCVGFVSLMDVEDNARAIAFIVTNADRPECASISSRFVIVEPVRLQPRTSLQPIGPRALIAVAKQELYMARGVSPWCITPAVLKATRNGVFQSLLTVPEVALVD